MLIVTGYLLLAYAVVYGYIIRDMVIYGTDILHTIPAMVPKQITAVRIYNGTISRIHKQHFKRWAHIERISLSANGIRHIDSHTFYYMHQLKGLYIQFNDLQRIYQGAFCPLENLETLQLDHNNISDIAPYSFQCLSGLTSLFLYSNNIDKLNEKMLSGLINLDYLSISDNPLKVIRSSDFMHFPTGADISFTNCFIRLTPSFKFGYEYMVFELSNLYIKVSIKNKTYTIPFIYVTSYQSFHLSYLGIETIYSLAPACELEKKSIKLLNFEGNKIRKIPEKAFCLFHEITMINLEVNWIDYVHPSAFAGVTLLGTINLKRNWILQFVNNHQVIHHMNLDNNLILHIHLHSNNLTYLDVQTNRLQEMPSFLAISLPLLAMYLQWNNVSVYDCLTD